MWRLSSRERIRLDCLDLGMSSPKAEECLELGLCPQLDWAPWVRELPGDRTGAGTRRGCWQHCGWPEEPDCREKGNSKCRWVLRLSERREGVG